MDLLSLPSPSLTALSSSRRSVTEKSSFLSGQRLPFPTNKKNPDARNLKFMDSRARISGFAPGATESNPGNKNAIRQEMQPKQDDLAFVAGATGRVGSRTVRELLKLGFRVRAGVRTPEKAQALVESVRQMKLDNGAVEKLEIVECDLERDAIESAIGNAAVVICCIGASEKEVFDITGPYRIDYLATKKLIDTATAAKVKHFILLTSLGTNKIGFPAAILNLFWGVLIWKRKAEEALIASGLAYTIVRPGGMERPTDSYKETHNLVLAFQDTLFGGQVSNLQVAELMAFMAKNRSLSFCKVVEVIAETTAPLTPMGDLLNKIPPQRVDTSLLESTEVASSGIEKEPIQTGVPKTIPLSPYTVYDDSKQPTTPSPIPTTTLAVPKKVIYEDLKPPTSPTPTPSSASSAKQKPRDVVPPSTSLPMSDVGDGVAGKSPPVGKEILPVSSQRSSPLSPYYMYDDLKPPASPSPTAPSLSFNLKPTKESNLQKTPIPNVQHFKQQNARPLSPFTMYEDLKPPTSPIPSPKKF